MVLYFHSREVYLHVHTRQVLPEIFQVLTRTRYVEFTGRQSVC